MKNIIIIGVILALIDLAIIWILKILDLLGSNTFSDVAYRSLSVIAILVVLGLVIKFVLGIFNN